VKILSSTSNEETLEGILYDLAETIENELHCFVYLESNDCCFIPYNQYDDIVGEINIDGTLSNINRLIALAHEVGHLLDDSESTNTVQIELNAWHLGYKYMLMESVIIDSEEYFDKMHQCLSEYIDKGD
tara:strand:+ start:328 stop:714 length:387 start_codon:yes stop_codon:yes gene_type:complete